jgi:hypothetical protein
VEREHQSANLSERFVDFGVKPLKTKEHKMRMVADAVYVERVSATKFPANREINRENRRNRPDAAKGTIT